MGNNTPEKIVTGEDYIDSLRGRNLKVYLFGELVPEPVDHPMIRPSINAMAKTYDLAHQHPDLGAALSPFTGERVNRFLHIATSANDVVMQNKMQRRLGQLTGTCFQRCVGMDALNSLYSVTYEIDEKYGTPYHERLKEFVTRMQKHNYVIGGAMTDVKGDRSKSPSQQSDPDMYLHVVRRTPEGVYVSCRPYASIRMTATMRLSAPCLLKRKASPLFMDANPVIPAAWKQEA